MELRDGSTWLAACAAQDRQTGSNVRQEANLSRRLTPRCTDSSSRSFELTSLLEVARWGNEGLCSCQTLNV